MRVKVGDVWYEPTAERPLMVELSEEDRANLRSMAPEDRNYAVFADGDPRTTEERLAWMRGDGSTMQQRLYCALASFGVPAEQAGVIAAAVVNSDPAGALSTLTVYRDTGEFVWQIGWEPLTRLAPGGAIVIDLDAEREACGVHIIASLGNRRTAA
jgi:hypothetical protein